MLILKLLGPHPVAAQTFLDTASNYASFVEPNEAVLYLLALRLFRWPWATRTGFRDYLPPSIVDAELDLFLKLGDYEPLEDLLVYLDAFPEDYALRLESSPPDRIRADAQRAWAFVALDSQEALERTERKAYQSFLATAIDSYAALCDNSQDAGPYGQPEIADWRLFGAQIRAFMKLIGHRPTEGEEDILSMRGYSQ